MNFYGKSIISTLILGAFFVIAVGSIRGALPSFEYKYTHHSDGTITRKADDALATYEVMRGKTDDKGRFHGRVEIRIPIPPNADHVVAEYSHGELNGWYVSYNAQGDIIGADYYKDGQLTSPPPDSNAASERTQQADKLSISLGETLGSVQLRIKSERPWFFINMTAYGYSMDGLSNFLADLDNQLRASTPRSTRDFDEAFSDAISILNDNPFHSAISKGYKAIVSLQAYDAAKDDSTRLAILGRYRSGENSTYEQLQQNDLRYLERLQAEGAVLNDIKAYYDILDAHLASQATPDTNDPLFSNNIDRMIDKALSEIYNEKVDLRTMQLVLLQEYVNLMHARDPVYLAAKHAYFEAATTCLLNWAEWNYPNLFSTNRPQQQMKWPYVFRYYPDTDSYVGLSLIDYKIYFLGANRILRDVGEISQWLQRSECPGEAL